MKLTELKNGKCAFLVENNASGTIRRRLLDLGFIKGALVECCFRNPSGDSVAYCIKGTTIALRKEISDLITISNTLDI